MLAKTALVFSMFLGSSICFAAKQEIPKYKPGQCVRDTDNEEPWRPGLIYKIVRSGYRHYRLVVWSPESKTYFGDEEILFSTVDKWPRTLCEG